MLSSCVTRPNGPWGAEEIALEEMSLAIYQKGWKRRGIERPPSRKELAGIAGVKT